MSKEDGQFTLSFSHTNSQGFPQCLRIRKSSEFTAVFKHPERRLNGQGVWILAKKNSLGHPRLGLAIAKKHVSGAVMRNYIKRVIRESFRLNQHLIQGWDIVAVSRPDLSAKVDSLSITLDTQWQRLAACGD